MSRRVSIVIVLLVFVSSAIAQIGGRQTQDAAWKTFWPKFVAAVNSRSHARVKQLMASEADFFSGGGSENRTEWLQMITERRAWPELQRSVRKGTRPDPGKNFTWPARVTSDNRLCFGFIRGRWRFTGPMGD